MILLLINIMQNMQPLEVKSCIFIVSQLFIIIFARFFSKEGLYIYSVVAIIIANIQVLKAVEIFPFEHPIPMGSIIFTSLFLVSDIITELWGKKAAQKGIMLGFVASLMFSCIMLLTIGLRPLSSDLEEHKAFIDAHNAIAYLFTPSMAILLASLFAYIISLWVDVTIFHYIKLFTGEKLLWLRSFVSSTIGIVVDNIVFSLLAWVVFAVIPVPLLTVINSYILGTLAMRLFLTIISIPVFYWIRKIVKNFRNKASE